MGNAMVKEHGGHCSIAAERQGFVMAGNPRKMSVFEQIKSGLDDALAHAKDGPARLLGMGMLPMLYWRKAGSAGSAEGDCHFRQVGG